MHKVFNNDQLNMLTVGTHKGSEWHSDTVKKALQLNFACGRRGYEMLLDQNLPLPSLRTLSRRLEGIKFESGVLSDVFDMLKVKVNTLEGHAKDCCLTLDEMKISSKIEYDKGSDKYIGHVTLPDHSGTAEHALVFMLSGITVRWKQVVAFYFTGNSVNGAKFKAIVLDIIEAASQIGFNVLAVTSDMGAANQAMWKAFGIGISKSKQLCCCPHPFNEGNQLYFLADPPHVLKNLRNFFVSGQLLKLPKSIVDKFSLPSDIVSAEPIIKLYNAQEDEGLDADLRMAPKLTADVIDPKNFAKMNVRIAMVFFSKPVEAAIRMKVNDDDWDNSFLTTCWFLSLIRQWFALMSSRELTLAISKANAEEYGKTVELLNSVCELFKVGLFGSCWKPVQTGVILSTLSVLKLQEDILAKDNSRFLLTSRLSQDCLENLFSTVRLKSPIPSALQFTRNLKLITVSQFLKVPQNSSYDVDEASYLADFLLPGSNSISSDVSVEQDNALMLNAEQVVEVLDRQLSKSELHTVNYVAGFCIKDVVGLCNVCDEFVRIAPCETANLESHKFTANMEFKANKRSLLYATAPVVQLLKNAENYFKFVKGKVTDDVGVKQHLVHNMLQYGCEL
jgi:hypothetical protein